MALTEKQQRFVAEYMVDSNATQAAIRAGYSSRTAKQQGSDLLTKPDVQAALAQLKDAQAERLQISADDVLRDLQRVVRIALADEGVEIEQLINGHSATGRERKPNLTAAVQALEKIGKAIGMYDEKVQHDGKIVVCWEDDDD